MPLNGKELHFDHTAASGSVHSVNAVVGSGVEFTYGSYFSINVTGRDIQFTAQTAGTFNPGAFNGMVITDHLDTLPNFTAISIFVNGTAGPIDLSRYWVEDDKIHLNFQGLNLSDLHGITFRVVLGDEPTDIGLSNDAVNEGAVGAIIGDLTTVDADQSSGHVYRIDDPRFEIVGGQLKLKDSVVLDYAIDQTISVIVTSTDEWDNELAQTFTIRVLENSPPPNTAPVFTSPAGLTIRENQTLIGSLTAHDPDGDALTFSIVGGADAALFTINRNNGTLSFIEAPDYEAPLSADGSNSYNVRISVSDGTASASQLFTVNVLDTVEIARFYNIRTGSHFYTSDSNERDQLIATSTDHIFEGETFSSAATTADGVSVHRFYNEVTGGHFYTADSAEAAFVRANLPQFLSEGEAFTAYEHDQNDRQAVFRFYNTDTRAHFYTSDEAERDKVLVTLPQFNYEGVGFYVDLA